MLSARQAGRIHRNVGLDDAICGRTDIRKVAGSPSKIEPASQFRNPMVDTGSIAPVGGSVRGSIPIHGVG